MYYFLYDNYDPRNKAILNHNEYDRFDCENCGAIHVTYKGIFNFTIMGKLLDYYMVSGTPVISEKLLSVLRENEITGFKVSETAPHYGTSTMIGNPIKKKYYRLTVTGRCGPMCDLNGEPLPYCKKCKYKIDSIGFIANGVSFASDAYDGSDFITFDSWNNIPIVSEKVKDVLKKSKLTNLRFVPLTEYIYNETIKKENALEMIDKRETFPELIEAWLKYGVITEDMIPKK